MSLNMLICTVKDAISAKQGSFVCISIYFGGRFIIVNKHRLLVSAPSQAPPNSCSCRIHCIFVCIRAIKVTNVLPYIRQLWLASQLAHRQELVYYFTVGGYSSSPVGLLTVYCASTNSLRPSTSPTARLYAFNWKNQYLLAKKKTVLCPFTSNQDK